MFRAAYFTDDYDATLAFYREGLGFEIDDAWDRGPDDRGTLFLASTGIIEVLARPADPAAIGPWDDRPPQGIIFVIAVDDVDALFARASQRVPVARTLANESWGHRSFTVTDPNGIRLYLYSPVRTD